MQISEILDQKSWDIFITSHGSQFLQSWVWGNFQRTIKRKIWYLAIKDNQQIIGLALVIKQALPFGKNYLYSPRGPIFISKHQQAQELFFKKIKELAQQEKAVFFRFEPFDAKQLILNAKRVDDLQPSQTTILDLAQSEESLLVKMHPKTRYNIRLAQKHGVQVYESKKNSDFEIFLKLIHQTAQRAKFNPHPDDYYRQLLKQTQFSKLFLARYKNKVLAAQIIIYFGSTVTYVHGASSREYSLAMASYLLHWEVIKQASQQGFKFYDFWGLNKKKWPGFTRFKIGFGGQPVVYPGTFDLPFSNFWYFLYKLGKLMRF